MSLEEYQEYLGHEQNVNDAMAASKEEGGPRVTLVPDPVSVPEEYPPFEIDDPDDEDDEPRDPSTELGTAVPFAPEPTRRVSGWSAYRQTMFIEALAETGSVHAAAMTAKLSARGAYALRLRSRAFSAAWDAAQQLAVGRLSALAFDRAVHGRIEQIYSGGMLVGERRVPSERLLMWLLARLDPKRFAAPWECRKDDVADPQADAQEAFPALLNALVDTPAE